MKKNQLLSLALALALVIGLLPVFAAAQTGSGTFSDISDADTARNVEILRMMGVIDGMGNGLFQPEGLLTRAQFCKMAITLMGKEEATGQYKDFTIFPDVRGTHWAAGFINLAVRGETKLLSGYPNGTFGPDDKVTYAQAVTILMRLLGYKDEEVGAVWPDGYLSTAATIGLTDGLHSGAGAALTRAQAAKLFVNLLSTHKKDTSSDYITSISGSIQENAVLLSVDGTADDGTEHVILTSAGTYKPAKRQPSSVLEGTKGSVVLDAEGRCLTFLPSRGGSYQTFTISVAKSDHLQDQTGAKHPVGPKATAYYEGKTATYGEIFKSLRTGTVATVYYNAAGVADYLFVSSSAATQAVIISANGSVDNLSLLSPAAGYRLYKNGAAITAADLRQYDVATYDSAAKIVHISDVRLTGCYEDVYPNLEAPAKITVMGVSFNVLPSAVSDLSGFKIGDTVTLLLSHDNQVAGVRKPSTEALNNTCGIVKSVSASSAAVELFNGLTVSGNPGLTAAAAENYVGQLVKVSSYKTGQISLSRLSGSASGSFQAKTRTVGNTPVADNVQVFEKVGASGLTQIAYSELPETISAGKISYVGTDYAGKVSVMVVDDVTGDRYTYGLFRKEQQEITDRFGTSRQTVLRVEYDNGSETPSLAGGGNYADKSFGGLILTADGGRIANSLSLTKLSDVPFTSWNKDDSVTVQGITYAVSSEVRCYNSTTGKWLSLDAARSFSASADLYVDSASRSPKIRVVVVHQ